MLPNKDLKDQSECFSTLFKYPETKDIMEIIKLSQKVEQAMNERLNGKNSNVYDILGIMKPIESEPTHIFSQDVYNQAGTKKNESINKNDNSKNNYNLSNNSGNTYINGNSFINNNNINNENENINNFEKFDEDEKENINLDSVNHDNSNNNNDIGTQAKSFFNSALNSLSSFGGIIKDQIQNATDTVIDSFTGKDTNNNNDNNYNYNYNNSYEDNYQQNDNIENNSNYNNNSNVVNRNSFNNENNNNNMDRKNSMEQNEEYRNQNFNERKPSIDSINEIAYNRQDIIDIVNKLKEFDTRYNMFLNDEDKKNFRIIIDYLKAKI